MRPQAALDVFSKEPPPPDNPLIGALRRGVHATPGREHH